jgi:hypothetical protein
VRLPHDVRVIFTRHHDRALHLCAAGEHGLQINFTMHIQPVSGRWVRWVGIAKHIASALMCRHRFDTTPMLNRDAPPEVMQGA